MLPSIPLSLVPTISTDQMIEVDRIMIDDLGIDLVRMMENAGRGLARLVLELARSRDRHHVVALVGTGGNGGGALVALRRLVGWGFSAEVHVTRPIGQYGGVPLQQLEILDRMGVTIRDAGIPVVDATPSMVVDGLIGYSLAGPPRGRVCELIEWANTTDAPVVSLDVPSGLDASTGENPGAVICANATMTLALPKSGLVSGNVAPFVGDLYLADIGIPVSVYRDAFGLDASGLFDEGDVVRLTSEEDSRTASSRLRLPMKPEH